MSKYMDIAEKVRMRRFAREALMAAPPLKDKDAEDRRWRLLALMREHEDRRLTVLAEPQDNGSYILAVGIPGATCELLVPALVDPLTLIDVIEKHHAAGNAT